MSQFKGYNACIDAFIEQIQLQQYRGKDIFKDIVPLCESSWGVIQQVRKSSRFANENCKIICIKRGSLISFFESYGHEWGVVKLVLSCTLFVTYTIDIIF